MAGYCRPPAPRGCPRLKDPGCHPNMKPALNWNLFRDRQMWLRPSVLALLAANLVPLVCVVVFDWEVFPLMLLFWAENVIIGGFNVLKLLTNGAGGTLGQLGKFFFVPFFAVHYGLFTLVHGVFVFSLFGGGRSAGLEFDRFAAAVAEFKLGLPLLGLMVSHGVSFLSNYLGAGEYRRAALPVLMMQPYGRVVILHVTVLIGGFLMQLLKSPTAGLALLVLLKCGVDLAAHLREREKFRPPAKTAQ